MPENDRTTGLVGNAGFKVPVAAASTAALTLAAEQTVDGVALVTGDRVLVKDQASSVDNGVYVVDTGNWERSKDADGSYDWVQGSLILVYAGTVNGNKIFKCTSTDPVTVDTDAITFAALAVELTGSSKSVWCGTATGTANALVLTPATAIAAADLQAGLELVFKAGAAANSGATTIAVSGNAAIAVQSNGAACVGGEIEANKWYRATLDGSAAAFQLEHIAPVIAPGTAGTIPMSRTGATTGLAWVAALGSQIWGLVQSNSAGDLNNNVAISAGGAMDSTGAYWLGLSSSIIKVINAAWAVGSLAGGLDTGAIGNNNYYVWLIGRTDTGVVDVLFSLSATAPTMPANYTVKRLIGFVKRVAGANLQFHAYETEGGGLEVKWDTPTLDINLANTLTTARRTDAVKVPLDFSVTALLRVLLFDGTTTFVAIICCPDETDAAPSATAAPLCTIVSDGGTGAGGGQELRVRTSAAGLIAARADLATVDLYNVVTLGFLWARR